MILRLAINYFTPKDLIPVDKVAHTCIPMITLLQSICDFVRTPTILSSTKYHFELTLEQIYFTPTTRACSKFQTPSLHLRSLAHPSTSIDHTYTYHQTRTQTRLTKFLCSNLKISLTQLDLDQGSATNY
ncbi:hypothetical protein Csa_001525 [Cucumis sativus]|uniref:Uncharacterized protein n=1 Tax=Cucumis sativus TaxID=3659 RepID=A0A0A0LH50_CUCSA|nr:hypothetical protein Csa_001525 [Cucumis sativus]